MFEPGLNLCALSVGLGDWRHFVGGEVGFIRQGSHGRIVIVCVDVVVAMAPRCSDAFAIDNAVATGGAVGTAVGVGVGRCSDGGGGCSSRGGGADDDGVGERMDTTVSDCVPVSIIRRSHDGVRLKIVR